MIAEISTDLDNSIDAQLLVESKPFSKSETLNSLSKELALLKNELSLSIVYGQGFVSNELIEKIFHIECKIKNLINTIEN